MQMSVHFFKVNVDWSKKPKERGKFEPQSVRIKLRFLSCANYATRMFYRNLYGPVFSRCFLHNQLICFSKSSILEHSA